MNRKFTVKTSNGLKYEITVDDTDSYKDFTQKVIQKTNLDEEKTYKFREFPHGWTSLKEFFISHPEANVKFSKAPDKITNNLII